MATADQSSLIGLMKRRKLRLPVRPDGHYEVLCFPSFNQVEANICLRLWNLSSTTVIDRRHLELRRMAQGCCANTHPLASLFLIGSIVDHRATRRCFCAPAPPAALESDLENTRELTFGPGLGIIPFHELERDWKFKSEPFIQGREMQ